MKPLMFPAHASPAALGKVVRLAHSNYVHFDEPDEEPVRRCLECSQLIDGDDDHSPGCPVPEEERQERIEDGDECEKCGARDIEFSNAIAPIFTCRACNHSRFDFRVDSQ